MSIWYVAYGTYKWKLITGLQNHQGPTFYPCDWAELQALTPLGNGVLLESEKKQKWDCSASRLLVRLHISLCTVSQIQRSLSFLFSLSATSRSQPLRLSVFHRKVSDWVVLEHTGALFYVQKSKSTSGPFEAPSNLLLLFHQRLFFFFFKLQLIVSGSAPLLFLETVYVWKQSIAHFSMSTEDAQHLWERVLHSICLQRSSSVRTLVFCVLIRS